MTLRDVRLDREQFMRHFGKTPSTISMHPADFMEFANDAMASAIYAKPDGAIEIMGMVLIEDPKLERGEIVLQ